MDDNDNKYYYSVSGNMRGFIEVKQVTFSVLLIAFVSALFLWNRPGWNLYGKPEDIKENYFLQHRPNISQSKYGRFKEYVFPSAGRGEFIAPRIKIIIALPMG